MKKLASFLFWLCLASPALAEKADKEKPLHIDADTVELDDVKKVGVFQGNVVLTQGTLSFRAEKVIVEQDGTGFKHATAYGHPVYFRQKREGFDEYVEGEGDRAEFDNRANMVEFFGNGHIKRGQDEVKGNYISYNSSTEFFKSDGGGQTGRVHAVIQPKQKASAAPKREPVPLESSKELKAP